MISASQRRALEQTGCDLAWDTLSRQLYATDASIYQVEPAGVAFPQNPGQTAALIAAAVQEGIPVIPRGAGSGLVGGALGEGLILDLSRHQRSIKGLDLDRQTVTVSPGVVLDQLNSHLKPHGFCFGPDVATSSRATLGGMIANNSSGAHVPVHGTTADHVVSLTLALQDGRLEKIGPHEPGLRPIRDRLGPLLEKLAPEIRERMPGPALKRWPGYGLDRWIRQPGNLADILSGSEGTLAAIVEAQLKIVPVPAAKGLGLIFFHSVAEAMSATVALLDLQPAALEHIDRILFDQTRGQLAFQAARDLMGLDDQPCEAILMVEFFDEIAERLQEVRRRRLGHRTLLLTDEAHMNLVWGLRKAGLSLLTSCKGPAKPTTGIEDTAIPPARLPAYVNDLKTLLSRLNLEACFYGHAASGLLHVRPVLDLHQPDDVRKFRLLASEVSHLVRQYKGSLAAEHGVGMARTEFMREHLGQRVLDVSTEIKRLFDPKHLFNPDKIFGQDRFRIDTHLRQGTEAPRPLPFPPRLAFAARDESFTANLEQCNGCGGCRKDAPTMCPTFQATGEEIMSTRGRANAIRAVLAQRCGSDKDLLASDELDLALSNCLACKACTAECPSNVNLSLLKAELLQARHHRHGLPLRARLISAVDLVGAGGCLLPGLANRILQWKPMRRWISKFLGLTDRRPLPPFAPRRFDHWFHRRPTPLWSSPPRGQVILWDDTFVRYYDPPIGRAAVQVLEAAGYEVLLPRGRRCCGRPAFSQGNLDAADRLGRHNLELLASQGPWRHLPVLFLEPSCYSMFAEDYQELSLPHARQVAARSFLFEQFMDKLLARNPDALRFREHSAPVAIHAHCHAKALLPTSIMTRLAGRIPGGAVRLLNTGCCGMAGAFGSLVDKYDLSLQVAQPLLDQIAQQPPGTRLVASGTSCRHQIEHLSQARPKHMAQLLAEALDT